MSFARSTDVVLDGIRSTVGSSVIASGVTVTIRRKPETDLLTLPAVNATNYPLLALDVVDDQSSITEQLESVQVQSIGVVVAMHFVARMEDVESAAIATPREYARKACEAIDAKIGATPALGTSIVGYARWEGGGQELARKDELHAMGLCEHTTVWSFGYGAARP